MKNLRFFLSSLAAAAALPLTGVAQTPPAPAPTPAAVATPDPGTVPSAIDLFRADIKSEKAVIIAMSVPFTDDEASEFWPLYNDYNAALNQLLDQRVEILKEYVAIHDKMTDDQATALAGKVFDWESARTELKRTWFKKFAEVIPAKKAAQFFQIDNQVNAVVDLRLMDALPLIKSNATPTSG